MRPEHGSMLLNVSIRGCIRTSLFHVTDCQSELCQSGIDIFIRTYVGLQVDISARLCRYPIRKKLGNILRAHIAVHLRSCIVYSHLNQIYAKWRCF